MEIAVLILLIVLVLALNVRHALKQDVTDLTEEQRGSLPGKGDHVLRSSYQSGMGGGNDATWTVPRDPEAYAKRFVPKDTKK